MSRKLPDELVPVLARTGHQWPQADEDGLRKAAGHWREFATESERLAKRGGDSAKRVTGENSGLAVEAFGEYWQAFTGGGKGHLDDAHSAAGLVAGAFDTAARAVDGCKADIVATLNELAAELKKAEEQAAQAKEAAAKIAAAAQNGGGDAPGGVFGGLRQSVGAIASGVRNTATEKVAETMAAVAVETAKLKIGGLLDELGRAMKDGLTGTLKEPAVVALLRLGTGPGGSAAVRTTSVTGPGGVFDPAAAGLPAVLAEPGVLGADGAGLAVVVGQDGKPVVGVPGLTVKLDAAGKPVLDEEGNPVIVRADGTAVADADGLLVVQGADGKPVVGVENLAVQVDEHGRPVLGKDGRPVLTDQDGRQVLGVPLADPGQTHGKPGRETALDGAPGGPGGAQAGPGGPGGPGSVLPGANGVVLTASGADGVVLAAGPEASVRVGGAHGGSNGSNGGSNGGGGDDGPVQVRTGPVSAGGGGGGDWSPPVRPAAPAHQGGGSAPSGGGGGDAPSAGQPSAPSHGNGNGNGGGGGGVGAPVTVRTDSVLAPPAPPSYSPGSAPGPEAHHATAAGSGGSTYSTPFGGPVSAGPVSLGPVGAGPVGPGPYAGGGPAPGSGAIGHGPAPFGGGTGPATPSGAAGAVHGTPAGPAGPAGLVALPGAAAPGSGTPGASTPGTAGPGQHAPAEARPGAAVGAPRAATGTPHPVTAPGPLPVPPPSAAPPVIGPGAGRPEFHSGDTRRRPDGSPAEGQTGLGWAVLPVATAHAMALQLAMRALRKDGGAEDALAVRLRTIADSRPYGLPGGLGPVDPEHQREVERRAPRDGDGVPVRHPDPAAGGWAEVVNDGGYGEPGRANNSLEIALSAVDTFTGRPTCAAPRIPTEGDAGERGGRDRAERELGAPFRDLGDGDPAFGRLAGELRRAGHGSQAVLLTLDGFGRPHAWNAVNHQDTVTYLDHQVGRRGAAPLHDGGHGLWAIALDPEGRPLDLAATGAAHAVGAAS
ncbi:toxin glutamine deamidase domain-containing protein [Kitasatospora sp. NPDC052868]|uniref:toxin glutamine deamidase domain-containing protein n=1 Tax=Kitasatospora sp. NPDC052868 TaxID=3364060 RepID=UPI0037C55BB2